MLGEVPKGSQPPNLGNIDIAGSLPFNPSSPKLSNPTICFGKVRFKEDLLTSFVGFQHDPEHSDERLREALGEEFETKRKQGLQEVLLKNLRGAKRAWEALNDVDRRRNKVGTKIAEKNATSSGASGDYCPCGEPNYMCPTSKCSRNH